MTRAELIDNSALKLELAWENMAMGKVYRGGQTGASKTILNFAVRNQRLAEPSSDMYLVIVNHSQLILPE